MCRKEIFIPFCKLILYFFSHFVFHGNVSKAKQYCEQNILKTADFLRSLNSIIFIAMCFVMIFVIAADLFKTFLIFCYDPA